MIIAAASKKAKSSCPLSCKFYRSGFQLPRESPTCGKSKIAIISKRDHVIVGILLNNLMEAAKQLNTADHVRIKEA